jgi:hypothetical protein
MAMVCQGFIAPANNHSFGLVVGNGPGRFDISWIPATKLISIIDWAKN